KPAVAAEVAEVLDDTGVAPILDLLRILVEFGIHKTLNVVLVRRPKPRLFVPDRIERASADHQILRASDSEVGIDLYNSALALPLLDSKEIHVTSLPRISTTIVLGPGPLDDVSFLICVIHLRKPHLTLTDLLTGVLNVLSNHISELSVSVDNLLNRHDNLSAGVSGLANDVVHKYLL